ncbi:MAG: type II secretion system F family protein [Deltaproteobacteria bacterium]|nr:type II secretion system F family protein [Deltaproteobacteria bacterium]
MTALLSVAAPLVTGACALALLLVLERAFGADLARRLIARFHRWRQGPGRHGIRAWLSRERMLADQVEGFLTGLAGALTVTPNLGEALSQTARHLPQPMRGELEDALAQARLGRPLDEALVSMAERIGAPGMGPVVAAVLMGRRTGGDLPGILKRMATTVREMARLEGVVRTKTAEGRGQAWVMGLAPPGLMLVLDRVNPGWLAPLWDDPIGWIILAAAAVLEITAVALIRRIMAVDI